MVNPAPGGVVRESEGTTRSVVIVGRMRYLEDKRLWIRFALVWLSSLLIPVDDSRGMGPVFVHDLHLAPAADPVHGRFNDFIGYAASLVRACLAHGLIAFGIAGLPYRLALRHP